MWLGSVGRFSKIDSLSQDLRTPDCSCPIHRALATVSSGDLSPNYRALTVQLRKSYFFYSSLQRGDMSIEWRYAQSPRSRGALYV